MRRVVALLSLLLAAACTSSSAKGTHVAEPGAAAEVQLLVRELERLHPEPFHAISRDAFSRAADELAARAPELERDRLLVELMRLTALLGQRDGHSGIFPLDAHARPFRLYPLRLYRFPEGVFVVGSIGVPGVVGARLVAVVDVRYNPGGDVFTYAPVLSALRSPTIDCPRRLVVLIGAGTFSAGALFATEVERTTTAVFVGEPTGGSPNLYADPSSVDLASLGWRVNLATRYWQKSSADDARLAIEPDLRVEFAATDFFGGRDPVLAAAVSLRRP